jgi:D-alanyl-D-alanine carboxypeptidase
MLARLVPVILAVAVLAGCRRTNRELRDYVDAHAEASGLSGAFLVAKKGIVYYRAGFGLADREHDVPNRADTPFLLGPLTRTLTALVTLRLLARAELRSEGQMKDYLVELPGSPITVTQLLVHESGLAADLTVPAAEGRELPPDVAKVNHDVYGSSELTRLVGARPRVGPPGTYAESSDGYIVLGTLLERVSGKSYAALLHDELAVPLGLRHTGFSPRAELVPGRAEGYEESFAGWQRAPERARTSASGAWSSVDDLYRLDRALRGKRFLDAATKQLMWKQGNSPEAYGWRSVVDVGGKPGARRLEAGGKSPGFESLWVRTLDDDITVILLVNAPATGVRLDDLADDLVALVRGQPVRHPARRSAARDLAAEIRRVGAAQAIADFAHRDLGRDEHELIRLGAYYALVDPAAALAILELTAARFPASVAALEALGSAYLLVDRRAEATRLFRRVLILQPRHALAKQVVDKLR